MFIELSDRAMDIVMDIAFTLCTLMTFVSCLEYHRGVVPAGLMFVMCGVELICSILVAAFNAVCYLETKN